MLENLAHQVIAPGCQELADQCRALTNNLAKALVATVGARRNPSLAKARADWIGASLAANRLHAGYQAGPMADRGYGATFYFGRAVPGEVERILNSTRDLNAGLMEELGATTPRGMGTSGIFSVWPAGLPARRGCRKVRSLWTLLTGVGAKRRGRIFAGRGPGRGGEGRPTGRGLGRAGRPGRLRQIHRRRAGKRQCAGEPTGRHAGGGVGASSAFCPPNAQADSAVPDRGQRERQFPGQPAGASGGRAKRMQRRGGPGLGDALRA